MLDDSEKNVVISVICGAIFGLSWWLLIDILAYYPHIISYRGGLLLVPPALGTISLIGNNNIPSASLSEQFSISRVVLLHRILFFFMMIFGFVGFLIAITVCAIAREDFPMYARLGLPVQSALLILSNLLFKFATRDGSEDEF